MLPTERIGCPYCGEIIEIIVDDSIERQHYIEDCWVCCRPIEIEVDVEPDGSINVHCRSENDS